MNTSVGTIESNRVKWKLYWHKVFTFEKSPLDWLKERNYTKKRKWKEKGKERKREREKKEDKEEKCKDLKNLL